MKQLICILSVIALFAGVLAGCSAKSVNLTGQTLNPETGKMEETTYSRVLDGKATIVPDTLELYMLAELNEKKVSALYGLQQSIGALGPDDIGAVAGLTFLFYNMTENPIEFDLNSVGTPIQIIEDEAKHLVIPPKQAIQHRVGRLSTSWYKTDLPIVFKFTYTGKTGGGTLVLHRRTLAEVTEMNRRLAAIQAN